MTNPETPRQRTLKDYVRHDSDCTAWRSFEKGCTCGLDALLASTPERSNGMNEEEILRATSQHQLRATESDPRGVDLDDPRLPDALDQLAKLADFLDREIAGCCSPDDEFVIAPMFGVQAMRDTRAALQLVCEALKLPAPPPSQDGIDK